MKRSVYLLTVVGNKVLLSAVCSTIQL